MECSSLHPWSRALRGTAVPRDSGAPGGTLVVCIITKHRSESVITHGHKDLPQGHAVGQQGSFYGNSTSGFQIQCSLCLGCPPRPAGSAILFLCFSQEILRSLCDGTLSYPSWFSPLESGANKQTNEQKTNIVDSTLSPLKCSMYHFRS